MSNAPAAACYREVARYVVELHWRAPRTGERNLPRAGRFYAWALFESPRRKIWAYAEATGVMGPGGVETTELAILTSEVDTNVPELKYGEPFELSRAAVEDLAVALLVGGYSSARLNQLEERPGRCSKSIRLTHGCGGLGGVATCTGSGVVEPTWCARPRAVRRSHDVAQG